MSSRFNVEFRGDAPEGLQVGDKLHIRGEVTVQKITADLVDITALGAHPQFILGEIIIDLVANRLEVGT